MTKNELIELAHNHPEKFLHRDKSGRGYICPICGSGSGESGTGITTADGQHFTCWAGDCFRSADLFDIFGMIGSADTFPGKLAFFAQHFGLDCAEVARFPPTGKTGIKKAVSACPVSGADGTTAKDGLIDPVKGACGASNASGVHFPPTGKKGAKTAVSACPDEAAQIAAAKESRHKIINCIFSAQDNARKRPPEMAEYLKKRGLTADDFLNIGGGFDPAFIHPKTPKATPKPALIIPTGCYSSYTARFISPAKNAPKVQKVGPACLMFTDGEIMQTAGPVAVVEGEIDAISVAAAGFRSVALGGTGGLNLLIEEIKKGTKAGPFLLALDNDEPGQKAEKKLYNELQKIGVSVIATGGTIYGRYKDANELLAADGKTALKDAFRQILETETGKNTPKAETEKGIISAAAMLDRFRAKIATDPERPAITGFWDLDKIMSGGLFPGLYVLGALAAAGKTTFALQIADNIATRGGRDCVIFSLEMAASELIAKSISRGTFSESEKKADAWTAAEILHNFGEATESKRDAFEKSFNRYQKTTGKNIFIVEGSNGYTVEKIAQKIAEIKETRGAAPVVFVDYLQMIDSDGHGLTDKQAIDKNIIELKRISRDFKTPVFVVSSFNRESYNSAVNMASFKESGAIEYSADFLIGLQIFGTGSKGWTAEKMLEGMQKNPRTVEARILKNRNGAAGGRCLFHFFPQYNFFEGIPDNR